MPLFLCGTPIGNLEDITLRALRVLREADVVAAEDTRVTRRLLSHYDIHPPALVSYREDNERSVGPQLVDRLRQGDKVVVVSDAGLPGISDPGSRLAERARQAEVDIDIVPGPSAVLAGLVASGLGGGAFVFEGFLPRRGAARQQCLQRLVTERRPTVLFEAPHRLLDTLQDLVPLLGDRTVSVSRELTKKFEETRHGTAAALLEHFRSTPPRGEFTLVVAPAEPGGPVPTETLDAFLAECRAEGMRAKAATEAAVERFGVPRRVAYERYLALS